MADVDQTTAAMLDKKPAQKKVAAKKSKAETKEAGSTGELLTDIVNELASYSKDQAKENLNHLLQEEGLNDFKLGGLLAQFQTHSDWWDGAESFRAFIETKMNLSYRKTMYLIRIYECLVEAEVTWDAVHMVGWTRLKELTHVLTKENAEDWIAKAKVMTTLQLQEAVKAALKEGQGGESEEGDTTTSTVTTLTFKVHEDQKTQIREALDKGKAELDTEYDTVALEGICTAYLGGTVEMQTTGGGAEKPSMVDSMKAMGYEDVLMAFEQAFPDIDLTVAV